MPNASYQQEGDILFIDQIMQNIIIVFVLELYCMVCNNPTLRNDVGKLFDFNHGR